jgi:hypothetical protein
MRLGNNEIEAFISVGKVNIPACIGKSTSNV